jgi:prefoldin subunit 5
LRKNVTSLTSRRSQLDDEPLKATFELNDTLYAKASIPPTQEVYLWLGANVMLAYPIQDAEKLLESKLTAAKTNLASCEEDLDFLREQITVCGLLFGTFP